MHFSNRLTKMFTAGAALLVCLALLVQGSPSAFATPAIAEPFHDYYETYQGMRVLGYAVSDLTQAAGRPAQYFEKGCIEDHRGDVDDPRWEFMYSRLTATLMQEHQQGSVSGTSASYADIVTWNRPQDRHPAPAGFTGGTVAWPGGGVFVPYDPLTKRSCGSSIRDTAPG